jgi:hypothetical protein
MEPTTPSPTPVSPQEELLALQGPPEERVPRVTPLPYPQEWLSPPPERGLFKSATRVAILLGLLVVAAIAGVGVVRNW